MSASPSDTELRGALAQLKNAYPTLGVPKLRIKLREEQSWAVSEVRIKKILAENASGNPLVPVSHPMPASAIAVLPSSVHVKIFGPPKGKGLVAAQDIQSGEALWEENPWIIAPEWDLYDLQQQGGACAHCSTTFRRSGFPCEECGDAFCNRLCLNRARETGHRIMCTKAGRALLSYARQNTWQALHALVKATARIAQTHETDVLDAFATLGMEERYQFTRADASSMRSVWRQAFELYLDAFKNNIKQLGELATFEGFLKGLGKMSLNLESHGGLYPLHSHINHSCEPNISVRHLHQQTALARITILPKRDIPKGEELTITYIDPELPYARRKQMLAEWGFDCQCTRCVREKAEGAPDLSELESELKAGLGVL
ncbi:SET domain-containing protein [Cylindrobasidium torrendii FP15055 ss-10]|uniref:Histone-lysine N-methyltransferase SET5 n=1 Tax=Cylindrobasidium torrendii FP15055 ss-10 TaxID=1314674 RepID=A0A0D7BN16_9AGAR|nr:SET domain-containing protein [Cylindrobasidium torrendii FP15055 ss-10]